MITKPKMHLGSPVIRPGETYLVDGTAYTIITSTMRVVRATHGRLSVTEPEYILRNLDTQEREFMLESVLTAKLMEANRND